MSEPVTLADEIARIHAKLEAGGKPHFIPLLTVASVKDAIRTARVSYASSGGTEGRPGGEEYMQSKIDPLLDDVLADGTWPANAELDLCYEQKGEAGVTYQGLGVSLEIKTPGSAFSGFSLAILDLWYGRFGDLASAD